MAYHAGSIMRRRRVADRFSAPRPKVDRSKTAAAHVQRARDIASELIERLGAGDISYEELRNDLGCLLDELEDG